MPFSPRQRLAIGMLAAGFRCVVTAEACGVHRRTLRRWRLQPDFAAAVKQCLHRELRQQQERHVAASVAIKNARLAGMTVHLPGLRSPTATLHQQRAAAGDVLRATRHLINLPICNDLPNVSF